MARPRITIGNKKDHKVTVRLDDDAYQSLKEAIEAGLITNLSEALRSMIRRKVWEKRFSEEIERDLKWSQVDDKDLREVLGMVLGHMDTGENREFVKLEGFLEGMFSAFGGLVRKAVEELEKREAHKKAATNLTEIKEDAGSGWSSQNAQQRISINQPSRRRESSSSLEKK